METRPLSKLAVTSLILSTASLISIILILSHRYSIIDITYYIGRSHLSIILFITMMTLAISAIPALIMNIAALIIIKRNNLRGKTPAVISMIFIIMTGLLFISYIYYDIFIYPGKHAQRDQFHRMHSALMYLKYAESTWHSQDPDGNGINDYWTYDISCLHRTYRKEDNTTKVAFIAIDLAKADSFPASLAGGKTPFGDPQIEPWTDVTTIQYSLYYFQAMLTDENGVPYNQNPVGPNKILATNSNKFALVAYPVEYSKFVYYTFIINEAGKVYFRDTGSEANKIVLRWPDANEMKKWRIAD